MFNLIEAILWCKINIFQPIRNLVPVLVTGYKSNASGKGSTESRVPDTVFLRAKEVSDEIRSAIASRFPSGQVRQKHLDLAFNALGSNLTKCQELIDSKLSVNAFLRSLPDPVVVGPGSDLTKVCISQSSSFDRSPLQNQAPEVGKSQSNTSLLASISQPKVAIQRSSPTKVRNFDAMFPNELQNYLHGNNLNSEGDRQDLINRCRINEQKVILETSSGREVLLDQSDEDRVMDVAPPVIAPASHSASSDDQPRKESRFQRLVTHLFATEC